MTRSQRKHHFPRKMATTSVPLDRLRISERASERSTVINVESDRAEVIFSNPVHNPRWVLVCPALPRSNPSRLLTKSRSKVRKKVRKSQRTSTCSTEDVTYRPSVNLLRESKTPFCDAEGRFLIFIHPCSGRQPRAHAVPARRGARPLPVSRALTRLGHELPRGLGRARPSTSLATRRRIRLPFSKTFSEKACRRPGARATRRAV